MRRLTDRLYDVVVVGGGNAALTAAIAAHDAGARVLVLEKAPETLRGGNSRFTGGLFRTRYDGIADIRRLIPLSDDAAARVDVGQYTHDDFYRTVMRVTGGQADPELTNTLIERSLPTMEWMKHDLGVAWEFTDLWAVQDGDVLRFTPGAVVQALEKGVGLVQTLYEAAARRGIPIAYRTKLMRLLQDTKGRVVGAQVKDAEGFAELPAVAVVLGSGGFQANPEMRTRYLGPKWNTVKVRGTGFNTGDGHRAAMDLGAQPFGHWAGCHATPIDADAPPVGDLRLTDKTNRLSYLYGIMVNIYAKRFVDEGEDFGAYTYAKIGDTILSQPQGIGIQIFDQKTVHLLEERYNTGTPVVADTIEALAEGLHLDAATLRRTVDEFNAHCPKGKRFDPSVRDGLATEGLEPPKSNWAVPIDKPPYVAYPCTGGITFTFGGLRVNSNAQVLDGENEPISGLYASGEITGGFFYFNYPGGTGLMRGAVFGRLAGLHATGTPAPN
ncbi:MAG: FAD-dependent tricarballylate dehydrogenase TcuA [Chloroflexi bacterium]|nr:FAD-dependent tricarballylate dehydrogenase TcuA [Chloroflexota bacterium]